MSSPSSFQAASCGMRPNGELPYCPLFDFLFSNPFTSSSPIITRSPTKFTQAHYIPLIPHSKPIFVDDSTGQSLTWLDVKQTSLSIGYSLTHRLGLRPPPLPNHGLDLQSYPMPSLVSPIVLIHLPNGIPLVTLFLGSLAAGLTSTMVNPALTANELQWILLSAKPSLVVTSAGGLHNMLEAISTIDEPGLRAQLSRRMYIVNDGQGRSDQSASERTGHVFERTGKTIQLADWSTLVDKSDQAASYASFQFGEPELEARVRIAVILWSSGTSGKSKGVMCSHYANVNSVVAFWHHKPEYGPDERMVGFVPFCHVLGLQTVLMFSLTAGSTIYVMPKFEHKKFLELVTDHKITFLQIAPPVAVFLAKSTLLDQGRYDLASVRSSMSGGAPLADEIIKAVYKRCGFLIKAGYGLSEAGNVANQLGSTMAELVPQFGTVGQAMYGVELQIRSIDSNQLAMRDEEGEVLIRSSSMMNAYLDNEVETRNTIDKDGWMHTGDLGKIDRHGRLQITDRLKEVIKVKGFQVSPSDLEGLVCKLDAIGEVAVTSVYSSLQATEFPRAYIVPRDPRLVSFCELVSRASSHSDPTQDALYQELLKMAQEVKQLVESKTVHYKWLRGNIVFANQIPKSPSGKILKRLLKDTKGVEINLYSEREPETLKSKL